MSCLAIFIPAVSSVEAISSINVVSIHKRLLVYWRLRFSWKRNLIENKYVINRLGFEEHFFGIMIYCVQLSRNKVQKEVSLPLILKFSLLYKTCAKMRGCKRD